MHQRKAYFNSNGEISGLDLEYWTLFDRTHLYDDSIRRYDEGAARWMDLFRKDARLMRLHQASVDWYERKAAELRAEPELQELENRVRESDQNRAQSRNA